MARLKEKTIIKRRKENLMKIFSDIDGDKMTLVEPSIEQAAKMEQYIMRLSEQLDEGRSGGILPEPGKALVAYGYHCRGVTVFHIIPSS